MNEITYDAPDGSIGRPDAAVLKDAILGLRKDYWLVGRGSGVLSCEAGKGQLQLLLLPNLEVGGIYLKCILRTEDDTETWLSMGDRTQLDQNVECEDEWYAAVGLFLTPEKAWRAVDWFLTKQELNPEIEWVIPDDLPNEANW